MIVILIKYQPNKNNANFETQVWVNGALKNRNIFHFEGKYPKSRPAALLQELFKGHRNCFCYVEVTIFRYS